MHKGICWDRRRQHSPPGRDLHRFRAIQIVIIQMVGYPSRREVVASFFYYPLDQDQDVMLNFIREAKVRRIDRQREYVAGARFGLTLVYRNGLVDLYQQVT